MKNVKDNSNIPNRRTAGKGKKKTAGAPVLILFDFPEHVAKSRQTRKEKTEALWDKVKEVQQCIADLNRVQNELLYRLEVLFYANGDSK